MAIKSSEVVQALTDDEWLLARGHVDGSPFLIRFRTPVRSIPDTIGYTQLLTIVWPYAEEGSGALPANDDLVALEQFENRLFDALEHDTHAVVAAVVTFDGARQWVVYTSDFRECGRRIAAMPQNEDPYPIEMNTRPDPCWEYLRDQVLGRVG